MPTLGVLALAVALVAAACSSTSTTASPPATSSPGGSANGSTSGNVAPSGTTPFVRASAPKDIPLREATGVPALKDADRCELFTDECLLPFPSNAFTKADGSTDTKLRVNLAKDSMPANLAGVHIDPTEWNRQDGFSPGSMVVTKVPGIDLAKTGAAPVDDIGRSLAPDAPIILLDADTGQRIPYWAELDAQEHLDLANAGPERRSLIIRPARNYADGHRIVVALRNLKDASGALIAASPAFAAIRDRVKSEQPALESRRADLEDALAQLDAAGVKRDDLYLAWPFTVASTKNLTERVLFMRDDAFAQLGDKAPAFTVTSSTESTDPGIARVVVGTFAVPNYLTNDGEPGSTLDNATDPNGIPQRTGTYQANFLCVVPSSAETAPGHAVVYGHGLLGSVDEVKSVGKAIGGSNNLVVCGTDEIGMSTRDIGPVAQTLGDLSGFRSLPDRTQQAFVNELFLGRALKHAQGFRTDKAFQTARGTSGIGDDLFYVGNSQGGIMGGAVTAIAQDWTRAFLGVPGMNYSTLLNRSVDFDKYAVLLRAQYPDPMTQQIGFSLIQMLWDRGENNGYANHLTSDPLPGTPAKQILIFAAFGDHQVTNVTTDVLARTIGSKVRTPTLAAGRSTDKVPFWGIEALTTFPAKANAYVMWDFGTPAPPLTNTPNRAGDDPHGKGRGSPEVQKLVTTFLFTGDVVDVCNAQPCQTAPTPK